MLLYCVRGIVVVLVLEGCALRVARVSQPHAIPSTSTTWEVFFEG